MKKILFILIVLNSFNVLASSHDAHAPAEHAAVTDQNNDQIVSQPSDCHIKQITPCTFKSLSRHKAVMNKTEFIFLKNAVVKITDFKNFNLEPILGGFIILGTKDKVNVKELSLAHFPSYVDNTKDQVEVVDGKDFFVYKFNDGQTEKYLLDREPFIKKLASFYNNVEQLKTDYKNISPIYNKSFKQDVVAHKRILNRRIASVEEQKKQEAARARLIREQQRKNKEIFFKRTFVQ